MMARCVDKAIQLFHVCGIEPRERRAQPKVQASQWRHVCLVRVFVPSWQLQIAGNWRRVELEERDDAQKRVCLVLPERLVV